MCRDLAALAQRARHADGARRATHGPRKAARSCVSRSMRGFASMRDPDEVPEHHLVGGAVACAAAAQRAAAHSSTRGVLAKRK